MILHILPVQNAFGIRETTVEEDVLIHKALSERNRDTFDVLELPFGSFAQDFAECTGYRVNVVTKELEFSYPDPTDPGNEIVPEKPFSVKISELEAENEILKARDAGMQDDINFIFETLGA